MPHRDDQVGNAALKVGLPENGRLTTRGDVDLKVVEELTEQIRFGARGLFANACADPRRRVWLVDNPVLPPNSCRCCHVLQLVLNRELASLLSGYRVRQVHNNV